MYVRGGQGVVSCEVVQLWFVFTRMVPGPDREGSDGCCGLSLSRVVTIADLER